MKTEEYFVTVYLDGAELAASVHWGESVGKRTAVGFETRLEAYVWAMNTITALVGPGSFTVNSLYESERTPHIQSFSVLTQKWGKNGYDY